VNLRKDHCRKPAKQKTRELVYTLGERCGGRGPVASPPVFPLRADAHGTSGRRVRLLVKQRTPAQNAPRKIEQRARVPARSRAVLASAIFLVTERLSATDISALASMKNVAKCDTWCELQNPVNHRVFERKLRLKPLG
jgi:hypothetical protein